MKTKPKNQLMRPLSEERILQLSNDLSEFIVSGDVRDWRTVAHYWRRQYDNEERKLGMIQPSIAAFTIAMEMLGFAKNEIMQWQNTHYPPKSWEEVMAQRKPTKKGKKK